MSAATVNSRATVEAVTAANRAFGWAFRGCLGKTEEALRDIDDAGLTAVLMSASLVYHLAEVEAARREDVRRTAVAMLAETAGGDAS